MHTGSVARFVVGSGIERIDATTKASGPLAAPGTRVLSSGNRWGSIRAQYVETPATEWPEGYCRHNVINALIGEGCLGESWWPGKRRMTWRLPANSVFILPAQMPTRQTNYAPTEGINVEVLPGMLGPLAESFELRP